MQRSVVTRYGLVSWLFVLSAIAYLDRTNISIAGLSIGREFHVDNTRLGWVFSAFLIGYAVMQVPMGLVVTRFGSRRVLAFSAIWWAVFTAMITVIPTTLGASVAMLIAVRFSLGAGEAAMYPAASHFVERWFPVSERGKANGIIFAGVGAGSGITPPLLTAIILHSGWRASFWFSAALGLVAGLVWYVFARDTPRADCSHASEGLPLPVQDALAALNPPPVSLPWYRVALKPQILALSVSYFCFGYIAWVFFAWFYIYLAQSRGLDLKKSALYSTLPFLCMTVGCLFGGVMSDFLARRFSQRLGRCYVPATMMTLTAVLLVVGSTAESARVAGLVLAAGAGVMYIGQSCFWAVAADVAKEYVSVASGVMNMGAQIGGAVTASLTPVLVNHYGWHMPFYVAAFLGMVGAACWLTIRLSHLPEGSLAVARSH